MSGADALRAPTADEQDVTDFVDSAGKTTTALAPPGLFHNFGQGVVDSTMSGLVRAGRAAAVAAPYALEAFGVGLTPEGEAAYQKHVVDDVFTNAVDYWTPTGHDVGAAGQTLNSFVQGIAPLSLGPEALVGTSGIDTAVDLKGQGATDKQALEAGAIAATTAAVGLKLPPAVGKTLATRVASGAIGNVAIDAANRAATQRVLADNPALAQQFAVTGESSTVAAAMGAVFGGLHHLGVAEAPPAARDALLTASNVEHFANDTLPGVPLTPAAAVAHQAGIEAALRQVLHGERVNVGNQVDLSQFQLRPELAPEPPGVPQGYDAFRQALESGGRADARNPKSSALGIDQFTEGTWRRVVAQAKPAWAEGITDAQLLAARADPAKSAEMVAVLDRDNAAALHAAGQAVDTFNLYAAHHFGAEKAVAFAQAGSDTPMAKILSHGQIEANPYLAHLTKGEAIANWTERARKAGAMPTEALDAPNFGLGEFPRTIADDDPLLQAIPEGANGRETANIDSPERDDLRANIVDQHFADLAPPRELTEGERPVAYLMGGGGASGKGTLLGALQDDGTIPRGIVHVDPDHIKEMLPEYQPIIGRGDSRAAALVHEESSQLAGQIKARAMAEGRDMVLDRTLGNPDKARAEIQALKDAGYEVRLFGVTVDPAEAISRAVSRAKKRGRYVPLRELLKAHAGFARGFEDYAGLADHARLFDNSGPAFRLLADAHNGKLTIHDEAGYTGFAQRRATNEAADTYRQLAARPDGSDRVHPGADGQGADTARAGRAGTRSQGGLEAGNRGAGGPAGRGSDAGQVADPLLAQAHAALAENPDLHVLDEDGHAVPAAEFLARGETELDAAAREAQALESVVNCALRNPV